MSMFDKSGAKHLSEGLTGLAEKTIEETTETMNVALKTKRST